MEVGLLDRAQDDGRGVLGVQQGHCDVGAL